MNKKKVIMLFQHDDVGAKRLSEILKLNYQCKIFKFGENEQHYNVDLEQNDFKITNNQDSLTKNDFIDASLIYFRLWRMDELNAVQSTLSHKQNALFSEREWFSVFQSVLLLAESCTMSAKWLNPPSLELKSRSKPYLICRASSYMDIPYFLISSEIDTTRFSHPIAAKCISVNQKCGKNEYFRTTILDTKVIEKLPKSQSTPAFITEFKKPSSEVRVYFFLGNITAIRMQSDKEYVDIRDLENDDLICEVIDLPVNISLAIANFCEIEKFSYCCFDFIEQQKRMYLIDVTPNGTWDFYDPLVEHEISNSFIMAIDRFLK